MANVFRRACLLLMSGATEPMDFQLHLINTDQPITRDSICLCSSLHPCSFSPESKAPWEVKFLLCPRLARIACFDACIQRPKTNARSCQTCLQKGDVPELHCSRLCPPQVEPAASCPILAQPNCRSCHQVVLLFLILTWTDNGNTSRPPPDCSHAIDHRLFSTLRRMPCSLSADWCCRPPPFSPVCAESHVECLLDSRQMPDALFRKPKKAPL
jgi:hypothetical protein